MDDHTDAERWDSATEGTAPGSADTVESYEVDGGVVFFDAENPLAWVEASWAVRLTELV